MKHPDHTLLMHTVLDGEASPDERRELERLLAADPAARAEFDGLRRVFEGLDSLPRAYPPEGLVASVMQRLEPSGVPTDRLDQLSTRPGVFGLASDDSGAAHRRMTANGPRVSRAGPTYRGEFMSDNKDKGGTSRNRGIWIGAGIAAAALAAVMSSGVVNFPPDGKDASGTIVPAQRYRAPQNSASDVKLGDPAAAQSRQADTAAGAAGAENAARQQGTDNEARARGTDNEARARGTDNEARARGTDNEARARGTDNEARARGTDNEVRARGTDNEVRARGTDNDARARGTDNDARARGTDNEARARGTDNQVRMQGADNAAKMRGADNAVRMQGADNAAKMQGVDNAVRMQGADNAAKMQGVDNAVRMQGADNAAKMQGVDNAVRMQGTDNAAKSR